MSEEGFAKLKWILVATGCGLYGVLMIFVVMSARAATRDAIRLADVRVVQTSLELYYSEQNSYPVTEQPIALGTSNTICLDANGISGSCSTERPYLPSVPGEVFGAGAYAYSSRNAEGLACATGPCPAYTIQFTLEQAKNGLARGANCARPEGIKPGACPVWQ
ncbi:MAG: hypothetical protein V1821_03610 [bacterium]